ncbi:hypothetical protein AM592_11600 [Bacillus gobiensis]|uniref:Uncharacterized protein n=1 Tax=Bacillus gobiensis TaxID=1441095 RepID=A0A0M4FRU3_9BACI|nr:hypothetical protein AM592_11600 [Bacillus gobiensis]
MYKLIKQKFLDEVILGCFKRINNSGFIHWALIVFDEKYSSAFEHNDSLQLLCDKIYCRVLERYMVDLEIIEILHFSKVIPV